MTISSTSNVAAKPNVFSAEVHGELVLFDPDNGRYFGAGKTGERIWTLVGKRIRVKDVVSSIVAEFEVDYGTAERDVIDFLSELHQRDVLEVFEA
jgi:hypothetical protein